MATTIVDSVYQAFTTIREMHEDRLKEVRAEYINHEHYENLRIVNEHLKGVSEQDVCTLVNTRSVFTIDVETRLRIIFCLEPKLKLYMKDKKDKDREKNFATNSQGEIFDKYIVVLKEKGNANVSKNLYDQFKAIEVSPARVELFELRELVFNISKHTLVPEHVLIPSFMEDVISKLMSDLNIKNKSQFPVILKTDPMAKYIGAKPGDIVKILRHSPTAGAHVFYRLCV